MNSYSMNDMAYYVDHSFYYDGPAPGPAGSPKRNKKKCKMAKKSRIKNRR